jgi:2-polyprenyl-6-methoxyphenol hydroxylase-like FAD-dependent oxidoreductase
VRIVIAGAGAAGLLASLLLARAGHQVVLVERDRLDPAPDVESAAASAFRATAPQVVQPHMVMARCRELLLERLPDVYGRLLAAGAAEAPLWTQMPESLSARSARPGDARLTSLATRRSTVDWVLRRAVRAEPGIALRAGVRVTGLMAAAGRPPRVTGVRTGHGDLPADLVVDATGRRTQVDRWLEQVGARATALRRAECGVAYFSRHYRLRTAADLPGLPTTRILAGLDEFTAGLWGADNGVMQLAVAPLAADPRFRAARDPEVFTAVLRTVPALAAWLDVLDPISEVFPMAGLHNSLRRLVADGTPVVTGLHAIGDSVCTTNPTLGRGLSLALTGAADLLDVLRHNGDDRTAQALALDGLVAGHVAPFYTDQAAIDAERLAALRRAVFGAPAPAPAPDAARAGPGRVTFAQLRTAARFDPVAFRAFWKIMGMIGSPEEVYADPDVVAATREVLRRRRDGPPAAQPTREQLLAALRSAAPPATAGPRPAPH